MNSTPTATLFVVLLFGLFFSKVAKASQAAGTETLVGIVGKDFILLGADSSVSQSIALTASNLDKIAPLSEAFYYYCEEDNDTSIAKQQRQRQRQRQPCIVAAAAGDAAASDRLLGELKAQATLEEYENGLGCDVDYINTDAANAANDADDSKSSSSQNTLSSAGLDVDGMASFARIVIAQSLRSRTPYSVCLLIAGMSPLTTNLHHPSNANNNDNYFVAEKVQRQVRGAWNSKEGEEEAAELTVKTTNDKDESPTESSSSSSSSSSNLVPKLYWLDEYGSSQCIPYGAHGHGANFVLSILDQGFSKNMTLEQAMELMKSCFQQLRTRYVINSPQPPCIKCIDVHGIRLIR